MDCVFCEEFETGELKFRNLRIKRILYESQNFVVFPSLGQIVEGYLLIAPKRHYLSIAQIPNSLYFELTEVQEKVRDILTKNYCSPIFFEHGPISESKNVRCCVDHAHLHAVPTSISILEDLIKHFKYKEVNNFTELPSDVSYLFLEEKKKKYVFPINTILPSQYLRQILAMKTCCSEKWDWRICPGIEELKNTIKKLKKNL